MPKVIKRYKHVMFEPNGKHYKITIRCYRGNFPDNMKAHVYNDVSAYSADRLQKMFVTYNGMLSLRNLPIISISFFPNFKKSIKHTRYAKFAVR